MRGNYGTFYEIIWSEIKVKVCRCGSEVSETYECFCTDEVCVECGDHCVECGKLFHTECLVKDLEGYELCQPCFDTILQKAEKYDTLVSRLKWINENITDILPEGD